jgi:hypothetical protein
MRVKEALGNVCRVSEQWFQRFVKQTLGEEKRGARRGLGSGGLEIDLRCDHFGTRAHQGAGAGVKRVRDPPEAC